MKNRATALPFQGDLRGDSANAQALPGAERCAAPSGRRIVHLAICLNPLLDTETGNGAALSGRFAGGWIWTPGVAWGWELRCPFGARNGRTSVAFRSRTRKSRWPDLGLDETPGAPSGQLSIAPCSIQSRMSPKSSDGSRSANSGMVLPTGGVSSLTLRYSRLFAGSIGTTSVSSGSFTLG